MGGLKVGELYAELRLDKNRFDEGLAASGGGFSKFVGIVKAGALVAVAAIAGIAAVSIKTAADFDAALTQSFAIMGDLTEEVRDRMSQAARDIAKETTFSAAQAAEALYFLASAGLSAEQSISALPIVARFAQAGVMDLATATEFLVDSQNALGLASKDAAQNQENLARVADVLTRANIKSNATVEQFAAALTNKAAAAAKLVGKEVEETVAVLEAFAIQGTKGEEAGEKFAIVLRDLQTQAIKNGDAFREAGVRVFDASGEMRNMADIVEDLENHLAGMSDEQKRAALMTLGFQDRSVAATMSLLGMSDAIREYEADLRSAGGATEEVANKQLESFNAQAEIMWHKIQDVAISIGNVLLPVLIPLIEGVGDWFDENAELITQLTEDFVGAIQAAADIVGGTLGPVIEGVQPIVAGLASALSEIGAFLNGIFGDPSSGPISGVTEFADEWERIGPVSDDVRAAISLANAVMETLRDEILPPITAAVDDAAEKVAELAEIVDLDLGAAFEWLETKILPPVARAIDAVSEALAALIEAFGGTATAAEDDWDVIAGVVGLAADIIVFAVESISNVIVFMAISFKFLIGVVQGVLGMVRQIINAIISPINHILRFMNSIRIAIPRIDLGPPLNIHLGGGYFDPFNIGLIPHLARGTRNFAGGMAIVGERGPELAYLPRGSGVIPNGQWGAGLTVMGPLVRIENFRGTDTEVQALSEALAREMRLRFGYMET